ncbi:MAG: hypothetical protein ACK4PI_03675 [Tepidisphaerales bacterium]
MTPPATPLGTSAPVSTCTHRPTAETLLNRQYLEMRWHILSLAADFDRIERAHGGERLLATDPRIGELRDCLRELLSDRPGRAERVQLHLSDHTPPPPPAPIPSPSGHR